MRVYADGLQKKVLRLLSPLPLPCPRHAGQPKGSSQQHASSTAHGLGRRGIDIWTGTTADTGTTAWIKGLRCPSVVPVGRKTGTNHST